VQRLRRSRVGPEDAFCGAVLKGSSGALDGGGAPPDTERAIPEAEPSQGVLDEAEHLDANSWLRGRSGSLRLVTDRW
jgi:hypothetical protein